MTLDYGVDKIIIILRILTQYYNIVFVQYGHLIILSDSVILSHRLLSMKLIVQYVMMLFCPIQFHEGLNPTQKVIT